jgi:dTDP-4-dehydrorhamnose 3,5-epimerase
MSRITKGMVSIDDRGKVSFVNDFNFQDVKRFYVVQNHEANFIRAWHGHKHERKYVYVSQGSVLFYIIPIDSLINSDITLIEKHVLSAGAPAILAIPAGYANGFKTLTNDAQIMFFSTLTLEESQNDDFRFPYNCLSANIWDVNYR